MLVICMTCCSYVFAIFFSVFDNGHATLSEVLSIRLSVYPSICPSVPSFVNIVSKSVKTPIYDAPVMIVRVSEQGVGEGMEGDCMPLPTCRQRYCDSASLVVFLFSFLLSQYLSHDCNLDPKLDLLN